MSDAKHHSDGVCLSCGGTVDENGMAEGGEALAEGALSEFEPDSGPETEAVADDNVRAFARTLQGTH